MRLLHLAAGNLYGGVEAMLVAAAGTRFEETGVRQEFALCFEGLLSEALRSTGATVHLLGGVRFSRPWTLRRPRLELERLLGRDRFDAVICHGPWTQAIFGSRRARARPRWAYFAHEASDGRHWVERLASLTTPDVVFANSAFTGRAVRRIFPRAAPEVVHPPVLVEPGPLSAEERRAQRRALGADDDSVVIVHASRMVPMKGHRLLLDALGALRDEPRWTMWIIGGPQQKAEQTYFEGLRSRIDREGLGSRVRLLGQRADVPRLLRAADVHCQANLAPEAFGVAYVEALAAGLPVVTTALGGALEIVDDSCGRLLPPDPDALAGTLRELIENSDLRHRLGGRGPERAKALADPRAQVRRWASVLGRLPLVEAAR